MNTEPTGFAHINIDYIRELADGDDQVLLQMLGVFITSISSSMESLVAAVNSGNLIDGYFYAHKLKGSLNFIGSEQATELLVLIEQYCKANTNNEEINRLVNEVHKIAQSVLEEILLLRTRLAAT